MAPPVLEVVGDLVYTAGYDQSAVKIVDFVDVSNPGVPVEVGSMAKDGRLLGINDVDGLAYLSSGGLFDSTVSVVDLSLLSSPFEIAEAPVSIVSGRTDGSEDLFYVPDQGSAFRSSSCPSRRRFPSKASRSR